MAFNPVPCATCGGGDTGGPGQPAFDVEQQILCDTLADGSVVGTALMVQIYDEGGGNPVGPPTPVDPATGNPYVVQGTLQPCGGGAGGHTHTEILCDVQPDSSSVVFKRIEVLGPLNTVVDTIDVTLDGAPYAITGVAGLCDPYRLCTPQSDINLNAACGPGQVADPAIIGAEGVAADSVINDDPSADPLCGGVWDRPSEASPFTVNETFRNATFDQPGPVTQGTPPYAGLTANPAFTGSNAGDAPGDGWLQTSDINSFTNGMWQVPNPFSTAQGMTARVKFASHDGTGAPNGDGYGFFFTNGAVPPQSSAIGGGGGLGHENWQGGYLGIILDEYGAFTGANRINLARIGGSAVPPGTGTQAFDSMSLAPKDASLGTTRSTPGELFVSIISEAGQTYVSVSILWPGDTEPIVYWNRRNVTPELGVAPATMRMSLYGGSGGAFRSEHEWRDAVATAAGSQQWRAFPVIPDPDPPLACVTSVRVEACVDVTFTEDTQVVGNGNPEAFLWLVNDATNTVLDKAQVSSQPSQTGNARNLCVDATVPIAQLANLRVYVGAETRDSNGIYGSSWENLTITAAGLGCPVTPVRTLAISAPCPIDVNIVGGTADGTPAPVTVVNTPSTFEDAPVCITIAGAASAGFRREVRAADGTVSVQFLGSDGVPVVPDGWQPGECCCDHTEMLCTGEPGVADFATFLRHYTTVNGVTTFTDTTLDGETPFVPVGPVVDCGRTFGTEPIIMCDADGVQFVREYTYNDHTGQFQFLSDRTLNGVLYIPAEPFGLCPDCPTVLGDVCVATTDAPGIVRAITVRACDGTVSQINPATGAPWANAIVVICPPDNQLWEEILCDGGAVGDPQFRRVYTLTSLGSVVVADEDLDGNLYVVIGPIVQCGPTDAAGRDVEQEILCDNNGPFLRVYQYNDQSGLPSGVPSDFTLAGAPYVPVGPVVSCSPTITPYDSRDAELLVLCDSTPTRFLRKYLYDGETGAFTTVVNTTLDGTTPFVPVGAVGVCSVAVQSDFDFLSTVLCDANGTQFIQRLTFNSATGAVTATTNTTLTGAAFAPVGAVALCTNCCPIEIGQGCYNAGSGRYTALRLQTGVISLIDSVTGVAVLPANIIPCTNDDLVKTLTAQGRLLTNATPWTPGGDVVGALTSLSVTGLSGLWDVVDQNGTALVGLPAGLTLTWSAEDDNTLSGPTSVTPQAGSSVVANWTQR